MSMMSSPTTASSTPETRTVPVALTTPFVEPAGCESHWTLTGVPTTTKSRAGVTTTLKGSVFVSEPVESCYPAGWKQVVSQIRYEFSPAVCPSDWTYYQMRAAPSDSSTSTTAMCCNSGFTLNTVDGDPILRAFGRSRCVRSVSGASLSLIAGLGQGSAATTAGAAKTSTMVHRPWEVTWEASDRSTLTPQLPDMTNNMLVPTWKPGEIIPVGKYDVNDTDMYDASGRARDSRNEIEYFSHDLYWFLVVGVPIIFILTTSSCIWCCVRGCRRNRRARLAAARETIPVPTRHSVK